MFLATTFASLTTWIAMRFLDAYVFDTSRVIPLIGLTVTAALMGGLVYLLATKILKVEEFSSFKLMLKKGLSLW